MSLLILVPSAIIGGHEFQSIELINEIYNSEQGQKPFSIIECGNESLLDKLKYSRENKSYYKFPQGRFFSLYFKCSYLKAHLKNKVQKNNIDRVMICGGTIETVIFYSHIIKSIDRHIETIGYVPMVVDKRILRPKLGYVHNVILRLACSNVDTIITINRMQSYLINMFYKKRSLILPNNVEQYALIPDHQNNGKRLVYCGRLDDNQKDIVNLIKILDTEKNPFKEFIIIGSGPEEELIKELCRDTRHITVKMLGWIKASELNSHLGCKDVLIMNSRWEGEPLVVREFSSRGLPVIARNVPGFRGVTLKKYRFVSQNDLINILNENFNTFEVKPQLNIIKIERMRKKVVKYLIAGSKYDAF